MDQQEEYTDKLEYIIEWSHSNSNFDTTFVDDLYDDVNSGEELSDGACDAIDNILENWNIDY